MRQPTEIALPSRASQYVESMKSAISTVSTLPEAKDLAGRAKALESYARSSGQSLGIMNDIAELKISAERKAGRILLDMQKPTNQHGEKNASLPTLEDLGVSRMQASRWQAVARVGEEEFRQYCKSQRESGSEITSAGVQRLKSRREDAPRDKPHFPCPSCGLRSNRCIDTGDVLARVLPRRRRCLNCGHVFRTWEFVIDPSNPPEIPIVLTNPPERDSKDS